MRTVTNSSSGGSRLLGISFAAGLIVTPVSGSSSTFERDPSLFSCPLPNFRSHTSRAAEEWTSEKLAPAFATKLLDESWSLSERNQHYAARLAQFLAGKRADEMDVSIDWCEDGSLLVELMLNQRRVGFSFEKDPDRSSWFISSLPVASVDGAGRLANQDVDAILLRGLVG